MIYWCLTPARGRSYPIPGGPRGIALLSVLQESPSVVQGDFDADGRVDFSDFLLFADGYGVVLSDMQFNARYDLDGNDRVGFADFLIFAAIYGRHLQP